MIESFRASTLLLLSLLAFNLHASPAEPDGVVTAFHNALISAMKSGAFSDRLAIVTPAVQEHFQVHTISRISLGRNWRSLAPAQQTNYQDLMEILIASTYASRFDHFDGQTFSVRQVEPITRTRMRVRSILETKKETVNLDYQLQQHEDGWRIYDIVANGVSDLSLKRSNYSAIFADGGLASVEAEIQANIAKNGEGQSD